MQTPEPQQREHSSSPLAAVDALGGGVDDAPVSTNAESATGTDGADAPVEVRVRAEAALIPSVRAVAADLAARADFDLDAVSDLRMAVDEVCSALVPLAVPGGQLRCGFTVTGGHIDVVCRVPVPGAATLRQDTFGWRVLTTLTDAADVLENEAGWLGIHLRKDRLAS